LVGSIAHAAPTEAQPRNAGRPADAAEKQEPVRIRVEITGLRSDGGRVAVALFNSKSAFPHVDKAFRAQQSSPRNRRAAVEFEDLPPGDYAVLVLHDENANGKLDRGLFGIPKEGIGASNDALEPFGPPRYAKAKVNVKGSVTLSSRLKYYL
jgi:uncharacterized protein (DUF2141 family)